MMQLYDEDIKKIRAAAIILQEKYYGRTWATPEQGVKLLEDFEKEAHEIYAKIGFIVNVDITSALTGGFPDIAIAGKIKQEDFDHDRLRWEIKKKGDTLQ